MVLLVNGFGLGLNGFHRSTDQFLFRSILLHLAFSLAPGLFLCWANPADAFLKKSSGRRVRTCVTILTMKLYLTWHAMHLVTMCKQMLLLLYILHIFTEKKYLKEKLV